MTYGIIYLYIYMYVCVLHQLTTVYRQVRHHARCGHRHPAALLPHLCIVGVPRVIDVRAFAVLDQRKDVVRVPAFKRSHPKRHELPEDDPHREDIDLLVETL